MKRTNSLVALIVLGVSCLSFRSAPPDLSSPKTAVKAFVQAINDNDTDALTACVKSGKALPNLKDLWGEAGSSLKIEVTDTVAEIEGDKARVAIEYLFNNNNKPISQVDILTLERIGEKWQIAVAPDALKNIMANPPSSPSVLRMMASIIGSPDGAEIFAAARLKAQTVASLSNMKQLSTAAFIYMQDYDEKMPTPASKYKELILPYVKDEKAFRAPAAPAGEQVSYSFNAHLQGVYLGLLSAPANTIMLYEGRNMKPEYRYEGKTVIGFADGHAKLCTPEEVSRFIWQEKEWKPEPVKAKPAPKKKPGKKR